MMTASPVAQRGEKRRQRGVAGRRVHARVRGRTGLDVLPVSEVARVSHDALACEEPILSRTAAEGLAGAHAKGADAVRVAERDYAKAGEHGNACIRALDLTHERAHGSEDVLLVDTELARLLEVVREDVEEELRVGGRVNVPVRDGVHDVQ